MKEWKRDRKRVLKVSSNSDYTGSTVRIHIFILCQPEVSQQGFNSKSFVSMPVAHNIGLYGDTWGNMG